MTSCGLNGGPLKAEGEYPAPICCNLTNGKMPYLSNVKKYGYAPNVNHEGGDRFIKDVEHRTMAGYKYFEFKGKTKVKVVTRGSGGIFRVMLKSGKRVADIPIEASADWRESETVSFVAEGNQPLYFGYLGAGKVDFLKFELS